MFELDYFLDDSGFSHGDLFNDCAYFWDVVAKLPLYLPSVLKPEIRGTLHPQTEVTGDVFIGEGTVVEIGARICGPAWIGKNCRIRAGAYLDGNIIMADEVDFGHCSNAYKCVIMTKSLVFPMSFLGASVIGNDCLISAGCTFNGLNLTREEIVVHTPQQDYMTKLRNLGAVVGHHTRIGGSVATSPGTLIGPFSMIHANAHLEGFYAAKSVVRGERNR